MALYAVGAGAVVGVVIMSLGFNMRINRVMAGWSPAAAPVDYWPLRRRWNRHHTIRTSFGLVAFGCFTAAALSAGVM